MGRGGEAAGRAVLEAGPSRGQRGGRQEQESQGGEEHWEGTEERGEAAVGAAWDEGGSTCWDGQGEWWAAALAAARLAEAAKS